LKYLSEFGHNFEMAMPIYCILTGQNNYYFLQKQFSRATKFIEQ